MVVDAVVSATGKAHINVALMIQNPKSKSTFLKKKFYQEFTKTTAKDTADRYNKSYSGNH